MEAIAVSSDGLLMAMSAIKDRANAERLAAVVSGMTSLAGGASSWYALGGLNRVIIDMADGYLLVTAISSGSVLGVVADRSANLGTVAYEMTLFADAGRRRADPAADRRAEERRPAVTRDAAGEDPDPEPHGPESGRTCARPSPARRRRAGRRCRRARPRRATARPAGPAPVRAHRRAGRRRATRRSGWRPR